MKKRVLTTTLISVLALLLICSCATTPKQLDTPVGFHYGNMEALINDYSGAVFEKNIADFERSKITIFDNIGKDVSVAYINLNYLMTANIYVYPTIAGRVSTELLQKHFKQVKNDIIVYRKNVKQLLEEEYTYAFPSGERFGIIGIFILEEDNIEYKSILYLFGKNEWFIKFRISYPAAIDNNEGVVNAIVNLVYSFDYSTIN
jgi:hypothetical protein